MKVLVFPKDPNPYQELLYRSMPQSIKITYLTAPRKTVLQVLSYYPRILISLIFGRFSGERILHIHWLYSLTLPSRLSVAKWIGYSYSTLFLSLTKILRYKVVWTVHNVLPHEALTSNDLKIRRKLSLIAAVKIVHSKSTVQEMKRLGLDTENCRIIPHGNYQSAYPNNISDANARKALHIPQSAKVIAFFGRVEPYKGVPELLRVYKELAQTHKDMYLLIAGKCFDSKLQHLLSEAANEYERIQFHDGYIEDDKIQTFLNAADICVYPFSEITTSGSILLASSFGKPIIAPRLGAIKDMPMQAGIFYDPSEKDALRNSILAVLKDAKGRQKMMEASKAYAKTLSWDKISQQTVELYESIGGQPRPTADR